MPDGLGPGTGADGSGAMVGREDATEAAAVLVDRAARGDASVLVVRAESGMGKSMLVDHTTRRAREAGFTILSTRGSAADAEIGFASLLTLMRPIDGRLDELAGDLAPAIRAAVTLGSGADTDPDGITVRLATYRAITALAEDAPVLIAVDDAHLLDAATADILAFVIGRLGADTIAVILTVEDELPVAFNRARHESTVLAPLPLEDLHEVVHADGPIAEGALAACCAHAGGNPLVALELARSLDPDERRGDVDVPPVPRPPAALARVRGFVTQVAELPPQTQRALVVVAADDSGDLQLVRDALADLGEPSDSLGPAEEAGVIRIDGRSIRLAHPLWRAVAYHQVAPASRRAVHRALAARLDRPPDAAARAWQLAAAADGPDEAAAAGLALVAGDLARRGGQASAARVLERAAALTPDGDAHVARLIAAARAWLTAFRPDEARRVLDPILDASSPSVSAMAEVIWWLDGPAAARALLDDAAETDSMLDPDDPAVDALTGLIGADTIAGARGAAARGDVLAASDRISVVAAATPDDAGLLGVPHQLAAAEIEWLVGRRTDAMARLDQVASLLSGRGWRSAEAAVAALRGRDALASGDHAAACRELLIAAAVRPAETVPDLAAALRSAGRSDEVPALTGRLHAARRDDPRRHAAVELANAVLAGDPESLDAAAAGAVDAGLALAAVEAAFTVAEHLGRSDPSVGPRSRAELTSRLARMGVRAWDQRLERLTSIDAAESRRVADELTAAEYRVALAVADGGTNREVAATLFLSVKTVDFHLQNIYRKLGLRSRTELAIRLSRDPQPTTTGESRP